MDELNACREFLEMLKALGVAKYSGDGFEVEFAPVRAEMPADPLPAHLRPSVKLGQDGMSADEQRALYGRVYDAEE